MNTGWTSSRRIASLLLVGMALSGCAAGLTAQAPAVQQQIEGARTRADHEALVKHYNREAIAARAKAAEHRELAKSYQASPPIVRGGGSMTAHCNAIASSFEGIAAQYDGMAASHLQMAEQAKP